MATPVAMSGPKPAGMFLSRTGRCRCLLSPYW